MKAAVLSFKMPYWLLIIILLDATNRVKSAAVAQDDESEHHMHHHDEEHSHQEDQDHSQHDQHHNQHEGHEESNNDLESIEFSTSIEDNELDTHSQEVLTSQEEHHNHDENHDQHHHQEPATDKDSIPQDSDNEFTIKSYNEDCTGANVKCSDAEGLICAEDLGKCECSRGMVYHSGQCQIAPEATQENSLENEDELEIELTIKEENEETTPTTVSSDNSNKLQGDIHIHTNLDDEGEEVHEKQARSGIEIPVNLCENKDCSETLGKYSTCDENTGECICKDVEKDSRPTRIVDGKCLINRGINDECETHEECNATIVGNAWCHLESTTKRFCQCEMFHYFDENIGECLGLARIGALSPCKEDLQCTGSTEVGIGLGPNSRCSKETNTCECKLGPNNQKGFLHENLCVYEMKMGDPCTLDRECEITMPDKDVICSNETNKCTCRPGNESEDCQRQSQSDESMGANLEVKRLQNNEGESEVNDEGMIQSLKSAMGLDVPNFVFVMIIVAIVVLILVVVSVFIIRKRHKYTIVRQRENVEDPKN
ncbi:unnamed protein product [Orchesella dallaii]|uniref:EGF-like domain-containing protein n=1 Tax=Orchesella dallaii TaxID=48710 RepID=A0ABP1S625_9HEXA